jgi:hypothetical protein
LAHAAGAPDVRCRFQAPLVVDGDRRIRVHGSFNPARVTCSTANVELKGTRRQYVLGQVARADEDEIELRPLAIATRLLAPPEASGMSECAWETFPTWQRVDVRDVEQFSGIDFNVRDGVLELMRTVPEAVVKDSIAALVGRPTVPKDWGGEQSDLCTTRLGIAGRSPTAAFVLKGPAGVDMEADDHCHAW